jgi:hypothetical protein
MPFPLGERRSWRERAWRDGLPYAQRAEYAAELAESEPQPQAPATKPATSSGASAAR